MTAFRQYLRDRFIAQELKERFAITDLEAHQFNEIVAWHDPAQSTPLRREMLRFSQIANKMAFDEVFVQFGRALKPELIVAQWNHLGDFSQINATSAACCSARCGAKMRITSGTDEIRGGHRSC